MNRKSRREDKQERKHPHKPPTGTTAAPTSPPPAPPPVPPPSPPPPPPPVDDGITRVIRITDCTDTYSEATAFGAEYYRRILAPYPVTVEYVRGTPMEGDACMGQPDTPEFGIVVCEKIDHIGTSGSTGMNWVQTGERSWALTSNIMHHMDADPCSATCGDCKGVYTPCRYYLTNHELGHSLGNLRHRPDGPAGQEVDWIAGAPSSCMSSYNYAPYTLTQPEIDQIVSLFPRTSPAQGMAMGVRRHRRAYEDCSMPPPPYDGKDGHQHHRHHDRKHGH